MTDPTAPRQRKHPNLLKGHPKGTGLKQPRKRNATTFRPGVSGNPKGKPPGLLNKITREVKELALGILCDADVQARLLVDARKGRLAPPVMTMLMAYAWGKPKETIDVHVLEAFRITITDDLGSEPTSLPAGVDDVIDVASDGIPPDKDDAL
jgi:hypothetical protein